MNFISRCFGIAPNLIAQNEAKAEGTQVYAAQQPSSGIGRLGKFGHFLERSAQTFSAKLAACFSTLDRLCLEKNKLNTIRLDLEKRLSQTCSKVVYHHHENLLKELVSNSDSLCSRLNDLKVLSRAISNNQNNHAIPLKLIETFDHFIALLEDVKSKKNQGVCLVDAKNKLLDLANNIAKTVNTYKKLHDIRNKYSDKQMNGGELNTSQSGHRDVKEFVSTLVGVTQAFQIETSRLKVFSVQSIFDDRRALKDWTIGAYDPDTRSLSRSSMETSPVPLKPQQSRKIAGYIHRLRKIDTKLKEIQQIESSSSTVDKKKELINGEAVSRDHSISKYTYGPDMTTDMIINTALGKKTGFNRIVPSGPLETLPEEQTTIEVSTLSKSSVDGKHQQNQSLNPKVKQLTVPISYNGISYFSLTSEISNDRKNAPASFRQSNTRRQEQTGKNLTLLIGDKDAYGDTIDIYAIKSYPRPHPKDEMHKPSGISYNLLKPIPRVE